MVDVVLVVVIEVEVVVVFVGVVVVFVGVVVVKILNRRVLLNLRIYL